MVYPESRGGLPGVSSDYRRRMMIGFQLKTRFRPVTWVLFLAAVILATPGLIQAQASSNMEILREKLKADKKLLIAENLGLTDAESTAFWPVYDEYQKELDSINKRLGSAIQSYANEYNAKTLTDAKAQELMNEALSVEEAEVALKKKYLQRLNGVIPAMKAVRYLQMENKIRALARYDLSTQIPLVE
jgi:hypothetical protein